MSDMSRPRSVPPTAAHQQHDQLLVAQFASGDPLDAAQQQEAERLLSVCDACAWLASDLRHVARAAAWEPVPPRRRDFRLEPEQAERLRGNPLTRFWRGLSLPRSRAFGPAAAGMLSLGLAFVVVGYAWPGEGVADMAIGPESAPAQTEQYSARPELSPEAPVAAEAPVAEIEADSQLDQDLLAAEEAEAFMVDAASEGVTAGDAAQKSSAQRGMVDDATLADESLAAAGLAATEDSAAGTGEARLQAADATESFVSPVPEPVNAAANGLGDTKLSDVSPSPEGWFFAIGAALALVGGLLLLLAWVARRTSDPLLR